MNVEIKIGDKVIFSKVPKWSYLSTNTEYEVDGMTDEKNYYFRNIKKGSGSYEKVSDIIHFEFKKI